MRIVTALQNSLSFPFSYEQAEVIAVKRGLDLEADFSQEIANSEEFQLSQADAMRLLLSAPTSVSEGGVSISFSDRKLLRSMANAIYAKFGEPQILEDNPTVEFLKDW